MAITSIKRDFVHSPNIVRMETTDALATVAGATYLADQEENIEAINAGPWTWIASDMVLVFASDGLQLYTLNADLDQLEVFFTATIADGAVTLAKLATAVAPSHVIKFADQVTTVGGAADEAITVTGAAATDLAFVQVVDNGTNNVTVLQAVVTLNTLTVTFSADPGADAIINYQIIRAV